MSKNFENEKWEVIEHSWSDTSIQDEQGNVICTLSIDDEDTTEENQEEREQIVSDNFRLISKSPEMYSFIKSVISSEHTPIHYRKQAQALVSLIDE